MTERQDNLAFWLDYIETVHPVGWDLGLERVQTVGEKLAVIQPGTKTILVAGTNGKGSCCEYLEALARSNGLSTGKSTSPHLVRFNERIQVNGVPVGDNEIVDA